MTHRLRFLVRLCTAKAAVEERTGRIDLEDVESGTGRLLTDPAKQERTGEGVVFQAGDVLFGKLRPYLRKSLAPTSSGLCSPELMVMRPFKELLNQRYFFYLTQSEPFVGWAVATSKGVKMPRTDFTAVGELPLTLPSVEAQREVVACLDDECARLDALRASRERHLALLDEHREATIAAAFAANGKRPWPIKWAVRGVQVGIVVQPSKYYQPEGNPLLRGLNVKAGEVVAEDLKYISDADNEAQRKSRLNAGDLVVVRTGKAGAAAVVPEWADQANCVDLLIIRPSDLVEPHYLEYFLNSDEAQRQIAEHSVGAIQSHFNVEAMKRLLIPLPPVAEQRATVKQLDEALAHQDAVRATISRQLDLLAERRRVLITSALADAVEAVTFA